MMNFRDYLTGMLVGSFISVIIVLLFKTFPTDNRELLVYALGQLSGFVGTALALYFGANKHGEEVNERRADEREKTLDVVKTLAENAAGPLGNGPTGKPGDPVHVEQEQ